MVKHIVSRGREAARVVLVLIMCIGAIGVPVCKLTCSIEPAKALWAHHEHPSDATKQAMEVAFARDDRRRLLCMLSSAGICLAGAVGFCILTFALRGTRTI